MTCAMHDFNKRFFGESSVRVEPTGADMSRFHTGIHDQVTRRWRSARIKSAPLHYPKRPFSAQTNIDFWQQDTLSELHFNSSLRLLPGTRLHRFISTY